MFEIKTLDDIRGNNMAIYSIKTLLERGSFPKLSIMSGVMGVGKTSVARVVANQLDQSGFPVKTFNFGTKVDAKSLQEEIFSLNPAKPRAFIFEELHAYPKESQEALLQMFDSQSSNIYIICTTTEVYKILKTIRSRARVWNFTTLSEKQLGQLLDDYLESKGAVLAGESKVSLLRACKGIPRDLISSADFALDGNFDSAQLDALLGNVSDELIFQMFCTLKSSTESFVANIEELLEDTSYEKINALKDFWLRFLMERTGAVRKTLPSNMVNILDKTFNKSDLVKVNKVLLRSTPNTLLLELVNLNMILTESTDSTVAGKQLERARTSASEQQILSQRNQTVNTGARLSAEGLNLMNLDGKGGSIL